MRKRNPLIAKKPINPKIFNGNKSAGILDDYAVRKAIHSGQFIGQSTSKNLYSEGHLADLIKLQFMNNEAKACIAFADSNADDKAWLVAHDYLNYPGDRHKHFSIETTSSGGTELITRMEFPWDEDTCNIETHNSNFTIGGTGDFEVYSGDAKFGGKVGINVDAGDNKLDIFSSGTTRCCYMEQDDEVYNPVSVLKIKGYSHNSSGMHFEQYGDHSGSGTYTQSWGIAATSKDSKATPLLAQAHSSMDVDIFQVTNSALTNYFSVDSAGKTQIEGGLSMNSDKINSVADPTADQDAATKKYVDDNLPYNNYDVIVASSGGDYTSLATAFSTEGANKSYYVTGTLTETAEVDVPDNIYVRMNNATLDFTGGHCLNFTNADDVTFVGRLTIESDGSNSAAYYSLMYGNP